MNKGKNNFTNTAITEKVKYKLWVSYDETSAFTKKLASNGKGSNISYYGFMTKPDKGLASLQKLVSERFKFIKVAILYDHLSNKELQRWENPAFLQTNQTK